MHILVEENLRNPIDALNNTINLFTHHKDLFNSKIPSTAEIGLIELDSIVARKHIQPTPKEKIDGIEKFIPVVIRERNEKAKKWLEQSIKDLSKPVANVEEYVEQIKHYNYAEEHFQNIRDRVDLFGQTYNVFADKTLKVKKEDKDAFSETIQAIAKVANIKEKIESAQEENKERFKKELNQLIPKLSKEIDELNERVNHAKFLDENNMEKMFDILGELDNIEAKFKQLEETKETYNRWQEYLDVQPDIFENLDECREAMSLRCLMWRSLHEW
jgi:DNA repair exonuclease SbcCD ATPase subunit